jgi:hypothetical protein
MEDGTGEYRHPAPYDLLEPLPDSEAMQLLKKHAPERGDESAKASGRARESFAMIEWKSRKEKDEIGSIAKESKEMKSRGPKAPWVIRQIKLDKSGAFADYVDLCFATILTADANDEHKLYCEKCVSHFGTRKNVWQRHVSSVEHKKPKVLMQPQVVVSVVDSARAVAQ